MEFISNVKGTWVFTHTAAAGWMKMAGADSPGPVAALVALDVVEEVRAEDDMAIGGWGIARAHGGSSGLATGGRWLGRTEEAAA